METSAGRTKRRKVQLYEENCVSPEMAEIYRQKTPTERLEITFNMWRSARQLVEASVRQQHPGFSDHEVTREVARRMSHGLV